MIFTSPAYQAYIKSPEWEEIRQRRLERDQRRCVDCGSDGSDSRLEVHHLTYERFGHERLDDLQTLCHFCHCIEHNIAPSAGLTPIAGPSKAELDERADLLRTQHNTLKWAQCSLKPWPDRLKVFELAAQKGDTTYWVDMCIIHKRLHQLRKLAGGTSTMKVAAEPSGTVRPASMARASASASHTRHRALGGGELFLELRELEELHEAGQLDARSHLRTIRRRIEVMERRAFGL